MPQPFNIAQFLPQRAREAPQRLAVICEHSPDALGRTQLTFAELDADSDALAWGLAASGVNPGHRVLLAVRPGLDFIALTFALFKLGAVPVLIDPGMSRALLRGCVQRARPDALIGIALACLLLRKAVFGPCFLAGKSMLNLFIRAPRISALRQAHLSRGAFPIAPTSRDSLAAILFTSGGTGSPKGVCYEHGMFGAQIDAIRDAFNIQPGEIDLPAFPLFALFSTALGTTCVIPDMNASRPALCNPDKLIDAIRARGVSYTFGSPAIWKRVGPRCLERGLALPSLKRILMAGAPVRADVLKPFEKILAPGADVFIPYGATEALPVSIMRGSEVLNETWPLTRQGQGFCVGAPLPGMKIRILISPSPLPLGKRAGVRGFVDSAVDPIPAIGEIAVCGPVVTKAYFDLPAETALSKFTDPATGELWHRMGDMGYLDARGRLWFCGRKAHRVCAPDGTVFHSVCAEALLEHFIDQQFGLHPRAALAGLGTEKIRVPVLLLEAPLNALSAAMKKTIVEAWLKSSASKGLEKILYYPKLFPVDVRHNAKIDRDALARWAANANA